MRVPLVLAVLCACAPPEPDGAPDLFTEVTPVPHPGPSGGATSENPTDSPEYDGLITSYGCFTLPPLSRVPHPTVHHLFYYDPDGTGEIQIFCPECSLEGEVHPVESYVGVELLEMLDEPGLELVDDPALVVPGESTMFACDDSLLDPGVTLVLRAWSEPDRTGRFECWAIGERAAEYGFSEGCLVGP